MSVTEWAAAIGAAVTVLAGVYSVLRIMIKSLLSEFKPNGGTSLKDQVNRIETRLDLLYEVFVIAKDTPKNKRNT
jgi:hypothetical protein